MAWGIHDGRDRGYEKRPGLVAVENDQLERISQRTEHRGGTGESKRRGSFEKESSELSLRELSEQGGGR